MNSETEIIRLIEESLNLERIGDIAAALQKASAALQAARQAKVAEVTAQALVCLAKMRFRLGQYHTAKALAEEAAALTSADSSTHVEALLRLGSCIAVTGAPLEAEQIFWRAANLAREQGAPTLRICALHNLAVGYLLRGHLELALAAAEEAYHHAIEHEVQEWFAQPLIVITWIAILTGRLEHAHATLETLQPIVAPRSVYQGYALCMAAFLALAEGQGESACALFTQARTIAEVTGEPWINTMMRVGMSRYHRLRDDGATAHLWADDAVNFATRVDYPHGRGIALIERGRASWLLDEMAAAEADFCAAIEVFTPLGMAFELASAWLFLAALRAARGAAPHEIHGAWLEAVSRLITGGYAFLLDQERPLAFPLLATMLDSADPQIVAVSERLLERLIHVPPPPLRILTLGKLEVWQGQRQIPKRALRQRRAGELLMLLLLHPAGLGAKTRYYSLTFDAVAEALWPEKGPVAAHTAFHHATSALRRALEPDLPDKFPSRYLEVEEGQVTLSLPETSSVDFEEFEQRCRKGALAQALALYGGEFLPEWRYADWTMARRHRLTFLYQQALLNTAKEHWEHGQFLETLSVCQQLLSVEPWHEQATLLGMRACLALNDRVGARRLYLNLAQALREDLQLTPSEELQSLYRSL